MLQIGFSFSVYVLKLHSLKLRGVQGAANYRRCACLQSWYNLRY